MTGVTAADFNLATANVDIVYSGAVTGSGTTWVLTVSITGNYGNAAFSVSMPTDSGSIAKPNAPATNNGFSLNCACDAARLHELGARSRPSHTRMLRPAQTTRRCRR